MLTDSNIAKDISNPRHKMYNLSECQHYLAIWKSIENKGYEWQKLNLQEKHEVEDALSSGEGED